MKKPYHFKNRITHVNPDVADKANFFTDYFEFTTTDLGKLGRSELENHKSLLEKVLFQLKAYTSHSARYIEHYLANPYLTSKDTLIKEHFKDQWKKLVKTLKKEKYTDITERPNVIQSIEEFLSVLDSGLFQKSLDEVIRVILCPKPLNEPRHNHVMFIEYYTNILVSEFVFSGFTIKELGELFKNIFERKITLEDNQIKTKAPLPSELLDLRHEPDKFYEKAKAYLDKRNLKQQFEGVYYLYRNSQVERTVVMVILNVSAYGKIELKHNGVRFSNQLKKHYVDKNSHKGFKSFFTGRRKLFAETKVIAGDETGALAKAIVKIRESLEYLNVTLKVKGILDTDDYVIEANGKSSRWSSFPGFIREDSLLAFENGKMDTYVKDVRNSMAERIVNSDRLYFKALASHSNEDKVVNFWRFLESFFDDFDYKGQTVQQSVAKILTLDSHLSYEFTHWSLAHQILYNQIGYPSLEPERFGLTREELLNLLQGKITHDTFVTSARIIRHPFVTKQLKWYITTPTDKKHKAANAFYSKVLFEAYEQRNFIEHSGISNQKTVEKILLSLPLFAQKFRDFMARAVKSNRFKSFREAIEFLEKSHYSDL